MKISVDSGINIPSQEYNYICPESGLHPIVQLVVVDTMELANGSAIFTQSPYLYEAIERRCKREGIELLHHLDGVPMKSSYEAFELFSKPFRIWDEEDLKGK